MLFIGIYVFVILIRATLIFFVVVVVVVVVVVIKYLYPSSWFPQLGYILKLTSERNTEDKP